MNKVLRKHLLRDLKSNFGRYLALFLLIVMGIYLVVSIVGASELIIQGTGNQKQKISWRTGNSPHFCPFPNRICRT